MNNYQKITALFLMLFLTGTSCSYFQYSRNYTHPEKPRYFSLSYNPPQTRKDHIKVVSYNIRRAEKIAEAIELLKAGGLDDADIFCLQEMDIEGVKTIAEAFELNYVYYPASVHKLKDFGNAVLTRWQIAEDKKIILPHLNLDDSQRIATRATIRINNKDITVFSVHLGVVIKPNQRGDQIDTIVYSVSPMTKHVVVAGDFNNITKINTWTMLEPFKENKFEYASKKIGWTYRHWYFLNKKVELDHMFTKGFDVLDYGKIIDFTPSDHLPIWVKLNFKD